MSSFELKPASLQNMARRRMEKAGSYAQLSQDENSEKKARTTKQMGIFLKTRRKEMLKTKWYAGR